tara:strand:+ start:60 stop:407 length:348 start_codon:yes stop_codon:yes gene_type:complete
MNKNSMLFEGFLYFILVVKILFVCCLFLRIYESRKGNKVEEEKYEYYEEKYHNLFTFCMGILLIILFSYKNKGEVCVSGHTKLFLFIFGVLSLTQLIKNFVDLKKEKSDEKNRKN